MKLENLLKVQKQLFIDKLNLKNKSYEIIRGTNPRKLG